MSSVRKQIMIDQEDQDYLEANPVNLSKLVRLKLKEMRESGKLTKASDSSIPRSRGSS